MSDVRVNIGINYSEALGFLNKELGARIVNIVLGAKRGQVSKWIEDPTSISESTRKLIASMYDVVSILRSYISEEETRLWIVSGSDFLFGIPAKEIRYRPEDVRMAALYKVSRGEDYEIRRLSNAEESTS